MNPRTRSRSAAETVKDKDGSGDEVTALARGLTVLRSVAAADAPLSNRELTEITGIPKPTVSRITATLVGTGFLFRLPDSERFVLTSSVLELSNGFLRNFDIRARARPFLIELAERTRLSVHLAVRDRLDMVVIDVIRPRSAVLVSRLEVGARMSLSRTAIGRAYLAALDEPDRAKLLTGLQAAEGDDWGHVGGPLETALQETIERGFAVATGEWYDGLNAIALGFTGPSGERYAVNCGGSADQCPRDWLISRAGPELLDCVARIVLEIGGTPGRRLDN
ncbi:MAG: IclR family transcriptional regulator [Paraburkholderia graminis]|jgi:DNA-binding IclR family transcriptional regulator|uniref:Transcriptional regulator, IclR family n=2 Tax=Paraburkholderia graminis TaxID=60548 RepID=B1GAK4_PARG4|nr:IclR family transcriptional regulator [Paraburkholderia graminis]ALE54365.1 IclR family transcriptional regulator [Burkholderia sp. HB1]EDT06860.1 transcriptional regulator, IclR family [Paraburkholderia graminis C4D1M]MDQ0622639.1 DNA-binding IclR family transcriptional regulator [Paraburkholderia graminis]MDR6207185.1 DNA-binding IclR family transcriptional regulator [Paraburkholderia graminis]CAB3645031.1 HTH-type transcriptional regulator TsaQ1/TsaQ2 [Paraburkholderia graminis C4D1M]